jgi:pteridine reductase
MSSINPILTDAPVALVTGASQRLGARLTTALHARGMRVVVHYHHSAAAAQALCATLEAARSGSTLQICADLTSRAAPSEIIDRVRAHWGRLDLLVNNAAVFRATPLATSALDDWDEITTINLRAPYFLCRAAAALLREQRGLIVNLADIYADRPRLEYAIYCASKAGLVGLTRALARELAPFIRVNAVAPGAILWTADASLEERSAILARTPLERLGDPSDIATAVAYLLDAPYVTGQVLTVDGGRSIFD